jgi:hypothetical protein
MWWSCGAFPFANGRGFWLLGVAGFGCWSGEFWLLGVARRLFGLGDHALRDGRRAWAAVAIGF